MRCADAVWTALPLLALFSAACDGPIQPRDLGPIAVSVVSGSGQTGEVGEELPEPVVVRVSKDAGKGGKGQPGVPNFLVNFRVVGGGGSVFAGAALTDAHGIAQDYWTLGPEPGENVVEVRAVDPTTGEKQVFGRFVAIGVVPGPEVCNGLDDDLDGVVDGPTWQYCTSGTPAPNTDGMNTCTGGYFDLNTDPADGCELLLVGTWTLEPALTLSCPALAAIPVGSSITLDAFKIAGVSDNALEVEPSLHVNSLLGELFVGLLHPVLFIPLSPTPGMFSGSGSFDTGGLAPDARSSIRASGMLTIDGSFTGPASFEASVNLTMDVQISLFPFGLVGGPCDPLDATVIGTRTGP